MAKKSSFKQMRQYAAGLPVQIQEGKTYLRGDALLETSKTGLDKDGKPFLPDQWYEVPTEQGVNHYRRIKKLFKRGGYDAVRQYADEVIGLHADSLVQHARMMAAMPSMQL